MNSRIDLTSGQIVFSAPPSFFQEFPAALRGGAYGNSSSSTMVEGRAADAVDWTLHLPPAVARHVQQPLQTAAPFSETSQRSGNSSSSSSSNDGSRGSVTLEFVPPCGEKPLAPVPAEDEDETSPRWEVASLLDPSRAVPTAGTLPDIAVLGHRHLERSPYDLMLRAAKRLRQKTLFLRYSLEEDVLDHTLGDEPANAPPHPAPSSTLQLLELVDEILCRLMQLLSVLEDARSCYFSDAAPILRLSKQQQQQRPSALGGDLMTASHVARFMEDAIYSCQMLSSQISQWEDMASTFAANMIRSVSMLALSLASFSGNRTRPAVPGAGFDDRSLATIHRSFALEMRQRHQQQLVLRYESAFQQRKQQLCSPTAVSLLLRRCGGGRSATAAPGCSVPSNSRTAARLVQELHARHVVRTGIWLPSVFRFAAGGRVQLNVSAVRSLVEQHVRGLYLQASRPGPLWRRLVLRFGFRRALLRGLLQELFVDAADVWLEFFRIAWDVLRARRAADETGREGSAQRDWIGLLELVDVCRSQWRRLQPAFLASHVSFRHFFIRILPVTLHVVVGVPISCIPPLVETDPVAVVVDRQRLGRLAFLARHWQGLEGL